MLPHDADSNDAQKLQWVTYQLKVWEKLMVQLTRAIDSGNVQNIGIITDLFYRYGLALSSEEFEFELEKLLVQHEIFENARDFI